MSEYGIVDMLTDKRRELKISQRELARRCNMSQSTIVRIETHQIPPHLKLFQLLLRN